ncbi:hypothetical protein AZH53_02800 [Methanomicrobiaceae archaeon CYW5]|uniref:hypothetical protein n=1 Tax=Methanovulcanius yangii TaxID=1789227 RepID=UPI0029C9FD9A|nr:hypothetical protein [Methanovulcanius yangii]MBT8507359.1 hypothetical protein [Methanovulcanius yangii]
MTLLRKAMTLGIIGYILIAAWQVATRPEVFTGAALLLVGLAGLAGLVWAKNEPVLKRVEMVMLWLCIGLFVLYGALTAGGVV